MEGGRDWWSSRSPLRPIGRLVLALAEGVGELLGHCRRGGGGGEGDDQSDGEENILHERSPIWCGLLTEGSNRLAVCPIEQQTCGRRPRVLPIAARYRFGASAARRQKASGVAPLGEGCGLAAHGAVLIDQLPHHAVLDKEAAADLAMRQQEYPVAKPWRATSSRSLCRSSRSTGSAERREGSKTISSQPYSKQACAALLA